MATILLTIIILLALVFIVIAIYCALVIAGCSDDDDKGNNSGGNNDEMFWEKQICQDVKPENILTSLIQNRSVASRLGVGEEINVTFINHSIRTLKRAF